MFIKYTIVAETEEYEHQRKKNVLEKLQVL